MWLVTQSFQDRLCDARFADAGFGRDQDHLPVSTLGLYPSGKEEVDLLIAANEWRHRRAHRFESALDSARAQHLPRRYVPSEALEGRGSEIAIVEQPSCQARCGSGDNDGTRFGQGLEAGGKVRRFPDDRLLLGSTCADEVAAHDEAGRDPDARLEGRTSGSSGLRNRLDRIEPGANCALSIMFMRVGVTEIGENAIAHVLGDEATVALDQFGAAAVMGSNDASQVLGIEPTGRSSRRDRRTSP